jgi:DNA-binding transcriptional regulator YhcF (GntR family)/rhodanese-related sulfurtransferase
MVMPAPNLLPISVNTQAPITINTQIAEQIKLLIAMGELQLGETLPTVTQLAKHLGVNHNTVAAVYNDLIESGYLVAQRGKGTFVACTQAVQKLITHKQFYNLLGQVYTATAVVELSPSQFGAAAYAQAVMLSRHKSAPLKLVFVGCLQHNAYVYEAIRLEIGLFLLFLDWEDLKASKPNALKELLAADLIITTAQHQWEVTQLTASEQEVIAINLNPDMQLLTHISSLPRNTRILLVCREEAGSQTMKQMLEKAGISHISFETLDLEGLQQNCQLLSQVDVVCVSKLVEDYARQYSPQPEKVMVFNFSIDQSNMSVLKARLAAIQLAKSIAQGTQFC